MAQGVLEVRSERSPAMRSLLVLATAVTTSCALADDVGSSTDQALTSEFRYTYAPIATLPNNADGFIQTAPGVLLWGHLLGRGHWDGTGYTQISSPPDRSTHHAAFDPATGTAYLAKTWLATQGNLYGVPDGTYVDQIVTWRAGGAAPPDSRVTRSVGTWEIYWDSYRGQLCRIHPAG